MGRPRTRRSPTTRLALVGLAIAPWIWALGSVLPCADAEQHEAPVAQQQHATHTATAPTRAALGTRGSLPQRGAFARGSNEPTDAFAVPDTERALDTGVLEGQLAGEPPAGVTMIVALDTETGEQHRTVADPGGAFAFGPLPTARYEVWATALGAARLGSIVQPERVESISVTAGDSSWLELDAPESDLPAPTDDGPTSVVRGTVVAADTGAPVPNAAILLSPTEGRWRRSVRAVTDDTGAFSITDVPVGSARLLVAFARSDDGTTAYRTAPTLLDVRENEALELPPLSLHPVEASALPNG